MKKAFITGVTGQDGSYLARLLLDKGYEVHGGVRVPAQADVSRLDQLGATAGVHLHGFDLGDSDSITRVIGALAPDEFYNLAAQSFVAASWDMPVQTAEIDGVSVVRILDALHRLAPHCRFYQASTSEMFGLAPEVPQSETTRLHPRSPYGVAKVFGHYTTMTYRESFGMHASSGILFNHESPLRGREFVTRKITHGLAQIAHGGSDPVELGNMNAQRDWGFAGDYVEGMWRMLQRDRGDDYVLATGVTTTIRDFFSHAARALDLDPAWEGAGDCETATCRRTGKLLMRVNPQFYRSAEAARLVGDASHARDKLGWRAQVDVVQLAAMMARADYDALA